MSDILSYLVSNRPLQLHSPLIPGMLLAADFTGHEQISGLFKFEANLLTPRPLSVKFGDILGKEVALELRPQSAVTRYFHGLVSRFSEGVRDEHFTHYRAEIVPKFWLWTQQSRCRVFQRQTVPEILDAVLDGLDVQFQFTAKYEPRDYCVQYQETDFAFANRLMEEEGIFYFFEHRVDGHTMLVADSHFQLPDVSCSAQIRFDELEGGVLEELRVNRWTKTQQVCPKQFTLWDFNFQMPDDHLEAQQQLLDQLETGTIKHQLSATDQPLEQYEYPGGYARHFDGVSSSGGDETADLSKIFEENQRIVKVRMQATATAALWTDGTSNCAQFLPGHRFNLFWHGTGDGQYLLTSVEHQGQLDMSYRSDDAPSNLKYENQFVCVPAETPFRPQRSTPRPRILGLQTATVVGPSGDPLFIDKYGRVKVQFHWDRQGHLDANSSCWVRVAQPIAGNRWGAFFWPRLGQEVVVSFEQGNPDRPLIVGSVYNADNMPPFELPENMALTGLRSCTLSGNGTQNFNTIVFDDTPGDEHLSLHSENHVHVSSELTNYNYVPSNQIHVIGSLPFGSGSGGGGGSSTADSKRARKSTTPQSPFSVPTLLEQQLGINRDEMLRNLISPEMHRQVQQLLAGSSGQGGGLWDFAAGVSTYDHNEDMEGLHEFFEHQMPSSFQITCGDATAVGLRDNIARYWSARGQLMADIEDIAISGLLGEIGSPIVEGIAGGILGFGGNVMMVAGNHAGLNYGGTVKVQRGESFVVDQHAFWQTNLSGLDPEDLATATTVGIAVRILVAVIILGSLICDIIIRVKCIPSPKDKTANTSESLLFIFGAIFGRLISILISLEKKFAELQHTGASAAATAKETEAATKLLTRADASSTTIATGLVETAERSLKRSIQTLEATLTATGKIANEAADNIRYIAGGYIVRAAGDILLNSSLVDGPSSITLMAEGAGATAVTPGVSGTLNLVGTQNVNIGCGGGSGGMRVTGSPLAIEEVAIDGGLTGTTRMFTGVPEEGPRMMMNPLMASILNGLPEVGSAISLQVEELSISCGPPGEGASITLTPMSLTLSLGENVFSLTPAGFVKEGLADEAEADVSVELEAPMLDHTIAAEATTEVALQTIL